MKGKSNQYTLQGEGDVTEIAFSVKTGERHPGVARKKAERSQPVSRDAYPALKGQSGFLTY